ncbi:unnamed protein product, partial [Polarella glacialis]
MANKGPLSKGKSKSKSAKPKDFAKIKNKVGKGKKAATNATHTDYKVKKVQMPSQNALGEKGEEVTHRKNTTTFRERSGLGLLELLAHMGHHSSKVRRDAYHGLHELCKEHDGVLRANLARILDATATASMDPTAEVRVAFRIFQAWLIETIPQDAVSAFAATLALQVRSALSHVSAEVREDGLKLLELYLSRLGSEQVLSQAESARVVDTLCHMNSHAESVLPCLHRLLQPPPSRLRSTPASQPWKRLRLDLPQVSLQDVVDGKLRGVTGGGAPSQAIEASGPSLDSPVWAFCLRAWLQAGDLPRGTIAANSGKALQELSVA